MTHPGEHVVAFVDIGTNSVRLLLVGISANQSYRVLTEQKEVVRLGEGEFAENRLQPEAMRRTALVCRKFAELARHQGAEEMVAVATAATREARNQAEFLRLLRREADLDVQVVSGLEEARLIYLGVSSGILLDDKKALFIDIGGGSTELAVGDQHRHYYLDSLQLGAVRLTSLYLADHTGSISSNQYSSLQWHVRNSAVYALQTLGDYRTDLAVGSSGTVENLAQIAMRAFPDSRPDVDTLSAAQLQRTVKMLCALPLAERRKVPGINPERADIIIAGAAILDTLLQDLGIQTVRISKRGLRDGLLIDYLVRSEDAHLVSETSVRRRSVLQLARACRFDQAHSETVANLALELFDSAREVGLHELGERERELLDYAALLHDVGSFLSYYNQHAHTYYLIGNADLIGFDQREIAIMATSALYHRRSTPSKKHLEFALLDNDSRGIVRLLSLFLRLAESLDRGHAGVVRHARWKSSNGSAILAIQAVGDCELQLWGVRDHEKAVSKVLGLELQVEVSQAKEGR